MKKLITLLLFTVLTAAASRAGLLFQDSSNYPYANGSIEGQGQWYCYYPKTPTLSAFVTNNVLLLTSQTTNDSVAAPTNGWSNPTEFSFAKFELNVSQLPSSTNGGYFFQLQSTRDTNDCCHVFIDTINTSVPGTYRLGIANFATSFTGLQTPVNYPLDLATGVTYTVVVLFDTNQDDTTFVGATLWINPSEQDFQNVVNAAGMGANPGDGFVYGTDTTQNPQLLGINVSELGFSPYIDAGISNVVAGTNFDAVNVTNAPVFGIQPQSGTNYSGNSTAFYGVASAVDATYQWYSTTSGILHDDGVNIVGSTSNTLTLNNLSGSDKFYAVVTDAYGATATSAIATNTVITTPTAPFFTNAPANLTNNLFTQTGFTNLAFGTGPLTYQWYFAPTNTPNTFSPLPGQTSPTLYLNLADYSYAGNYFVTAANAVNGGSLAYGPTNSITEIAPLIATLLQLHNLMIASSNQLAAYENSFYYINTNNVTVSGYVSEYTGYGTTYSEYFVQDAAGYGIEVFLGGHGNTNTPPIGTYVTISGPIEVYHTELEILPSSGASITTNSSAPVVPLSPVLGNNNYFDLATNVLGTNALTVACSLVTFTNAYLYGTANGGAFGTGGSHSGVGGVFASNTYTILYFTVGGPYHVPDNTNTIEVFQPAYNLGTTTNVFDYVTIPTQCYQLTGVYLCFGGTPEIIPSRIADYVTNPPPAFSTTIAAAKPGAALAWQPVQAGSTYTVYGATNLAGPWKQTAYGLTYYPTNGAFTDTNVAPAKFYRISSP
jgi:hypothetical protein